ncbi:MarR family transcriptional regulator [Photobacterium sp. SDRW27]|uniref:MarR family transcriptional regulator n=1 Tax=Photobacterium obscurum TaxID=2829490 RepID=UPI0022441728|nr:MarR family transcriptional regulator [Photobacterium obscurum]MCW8327248.1 MarR family transcriptional regulator [Photobacterium obscurum]
MRISHKRKVQLKLQKRVKAIVAVAKPAAKDAVKKAPTAETVKAAPAAKPVEEQKPVEAAAPVAAQVSLTPKQQAVLDIVVKNVEGINPKGIGLQAGQEDAKAASWATGALKKLAEEGLVERIQLAGNKVLYKAL